MNKSDLIAVKILTLSIIYSKIKKQKNAMKNALKNWKTTLLGAVLSCLYLIQKAYHDNGLDLAALDWFDIAISSAIILGAAITKDADVSGTAKAFLAFAFLSMLTPNYSSAQTTDVNFSAVPAAQPDGSILKCGFGGLVTSDSLFTKSDSMLLVVSTKNPAQVLQLASLNSFYDLNKGFYIAQGDSTKVGALSYNYNSDAIGMGGYIKDASSDFGLVIKPFDIQYTDTAGNKYDLLTGGNIPASFSKATGGVLTKDDIIYYGYGNGSVSGIDTIYLTSDGLESGNDLFRTVDKDGAIITVNGLNDSMLITKVISSNFGAPKKYITVTMKYLDGIAGTILNWATVPDGIRARIIVTGKPN